jgi:hypothetical protein
MRLFKLLFWVILFISITTFAQNKVANHFVTKDDSTWLVLDSSDVSFGTYHTKHYEIFGKYISGYNTFVLKAIDLIQSIVMDGGGYFAGIKANPPESPIGYNLNLFGKELLNAPRKTSYCSGSSYSVFIETLNLIYKNKQPNLTVERLEALRMQEPDGSRREDNVKFWGKWNADGYGNHFALIQYSGMGKKIKPINARPGDFLNISWKKGGGHSVVFLGWYVNKDHEKCVVYWSSQKRTNGLGNDIVPIKRIKEVMFVRLAYPENLFNFDVNKAINNSIKGDTIDW